MMQCALQYPIEKRVQCHIKLFVEILPLMQCTLQQPIEEMFQCHMKVMHILNGASALSGFSVGKLCENLHWRYG